jgi:hypothetical protein
MAASIHIETTVTPEGKIELALPELTPGQRVRVTIEPEQAPATRTLRAIDVINSMPGHRLFKTAEEVDAYINEERDSWDR